MDFRTFWLGLKQSERKEFAEKCGAAEGYLDHIATGYRKPSPSKLVPLIVEHSGGQVTREVLRPDIFGTAEQAAA